MNRHENTGGIGRRRLLIGLGAGLAATALPGVATAEPTLLAGAWSNPAYGTITSGFRTPSRPTHSGTDVANSQGTAIWAANGGTVVGVRTNSYPGDTRPGLLPGRTGNAVLIEHHNGYRTYYGHLYSASVVRGQVVTAGQTIAKMGTTGNSTGPHLHFEVLANGSPINPYTFLANRGITLGRTRPAGGGGGWPSVENGERSEVARVVQHLLTAHGHSAVADGYFGSASVAAAKAFQRAEGLVADGVIGPVSWPHLIIDVKQGSRGSSAKAAQVALNRHGAGLVVDGDFGSVSVRAARNFQSAKGLVVDGYVGPLTWRTLV
ncbi:putative peptidoglycan binding protein [Stackebrandtia albiflava]|uniref:Putative peptidoglycan binding protein n=1 Tax=Stackebrandtia albiflava TaxID=406432 RepID=A0A562VC12_9ACTN|nr:peptidoglycan DD-metalloendopeptidase family protein [Stackebrandtia albiflava]TWJ15351.1 putative peptidoglycan binding protein [Stackebrandtia albiflava]